MDLQKESEDHTWKILCGVVTLAILAVVLAAIALDTRQIAVAAQTTADPLQSYRKDLANETFNFLASHAVCIEGQDKPCDWVYDGAYSLHRAAKEIYSDKPLKDISVPDSDWTRGGYESYENPLVYLQHESIKWRIALLIKYGTGGVPPRGHVNLRTEGSNEILQLRNGSGIINDGVYHNETIPATEPGESTSPGIFSCDSTGCSGTDLSSGTITIH